jgi:hypothetical protein
MACTGKAFSSVVVFQEVEKMRKVRKVALSLFAVALLAASFPNVALSGGGACAPGQHGNQEPGFKPPSCPH